MKENNSERHVREFLEKQGFKVQRIPTVSGQKRADYHVTDSEKTYVVEVKGKTTGDEAYIESLMSSGEGFREEFLGRTNSISQGIREAAEQLLATPAESEAFRIVVFVATGDDPDTQALQIESTLYGTVELLSASSDGSGAVATPCFYFTFNEFFNLRSVDAALIFIPNGSRVYVNNFSQRVQELAL
jgi:Archaeal holliday junction resolvase (hjc).